MENKTTGSTTPAEAKELLFKITTERLENSGYGDDTRALIRVFADKIGHSKDNKKNLKYLKQEIDFILEYEVN